MNHFRARRLLPDLLDGVLPARTEAMVRAHASECPSCARALAEFEASEQLLGQLPISLLAVEDDELTTRRLESLARWAPDPIPTWRERLGMTAIGGFACAAFVMVMLSSAGWLPVPEGQDQPPMTVAAVIPDSALMPMGRWR